MIHKILGRNNQTEELVVPAIIPSTELTIIHPPIGSGAFGKVFKGKCYGVDVAIKVLDGITWDDNVRNDFIAEVSVMVRLLHPNIVLCMGACIEEQSGQNHYAIILEFMTKGDLHTLIHDKRVPMPLSRQLQCGVDICKGMSWLSAQNILHRDLKPANVLVDENWTCKICDFGLSQITKTKQKIQDEDDAAGSVLWMAPEVLLKQQIDSKLDVYSFSLVLWEIMTRADLFSEFEDKDTFTEAIAVKHIRPSLEGIHEYLKSVITKAWDKDPQQRPTFEELLELLQRGWIHMFIPDYPIIPAFWDKYFKGKSKAAWDQFTKRFSMIIGKKDRAKLQLQFTCLQTLASEEEKKGEKFISVERFGALFKWFGPVRSSDGDILDRIEATMRCDWFFGGYSSDEAEAVLKLYKDRPGTFLVRLNMGGNNPIEKSPFTISRIDDRGKIVHTRIQRKDTGLRIVIGKGDQQFKYSQESNRLDEFIIQLRVVQSKYFNSACRGSPFEHLFKQVDPSVYEDQDTDPDSEE